MNEFDLIARYFSRPVRTAPLGVGDDCAILAPTPGCELLVSKDLLVEHRHFFADVGPVALGQGNGVWLCTDGLWGALSDEVIARDVARLPVAEAVPELVESALRSAGAGSDNVTVIALEWETPDPFESTQGISIDSIGGDVFASTIQAAALDEFDDTDDLDDAAIERSIAEINEAIRRSAARKI